MKTNKKIPANIKCFNLGAMLLNVLWGIRHGIWVSFFTLIPIFGWIIMPIILGFKGNEWAWKKNNYNSTIEFLKSQRRWTIAGIITLFLVVIVIIQVFLHLNKEIVKITKLLNTNEQIVAYLGKNIKRSNFLPFNISTFSDLGKTKIIAKLHFTGEKNSGIVELEITKTQDSNYLEKLLIRNNDNDIPLLMLDWRIESSIMQNTITDIKKLPYLFLDLEEVQLQSNNVNDYEYLILQRSSINQEYMQVLLGKKDNGEKYFLLEYSNPYKKLKIEPNYYYNKDLNRDEVIKILSLYASGSDDFKKLIYWKKYNKIE